jgi:hypothetical protein
MFMLNFIYALVDPNTKEIRYIGKSVNPNNRLMHHWKYRDKGRTYRDHWLRSLNGVKPFLQILEQCEENWEEREKWWIAYIPNLTNHNNGGAGCPPGAQGPRPYRKQTPEHIEKRRLQLMGHEVSVETRERIGAPQRGRTLSEEHRAKLKKSPEQRAQLALLATGRKMSEETKAKMRASRARYLATRNS